MKLRGWIDDPEPEARRCDRCLGKMEPEETGPICVHCRRKEGDG